MRELTRQETQNIGGGMYLGTLGTYQPSPNLQYLLSDGENLVTGVNINLGLVAPVSPVVPSVGVAIAQSSPIREDHSDS